MNHYANKKSAAESMLDVALLMANASQLKAVMEQGPGFAFYVPLIILISISLILQILVGVLLIFIGVYRDTLSMETVVELQFCVQDAAESFCFPEVVLNINHCFLDGHINTGKPLLAAICRMNQPAQREAAVKRGCFAVE